LDCGNLITRRRGELGLTQGQLADLAATSRERINTCEREQVSPQADTLERSLAAMHSELTAIPALTFEERRSLAISTAVAAKLRENPPAVLARALENIVEMRSIGSDEQQWVDVRESLRALGSGHVEALLISTDQFARDLRQSSASEQRVKPYDIRARVGPSSSWVRSRASPRTLRWCSTVR